MSFDGTFSFVLQDVRCVDFFLVVQQPIWMFVTFKLVLFQLAFWSCHYGFINSYCSRKLSGCFSCNFSLNSIWVFSTIFCVSASSNCTERSSLSYKIEFHCLLKCSRIGLIEGSFFILMPNGTAYFFNANL